MAELEQTGFRTPEVAGLERRAALRHREAGRRLDVLDEGFLQFMKEGRILEDVEISDSATLRVNHGLGRPVKGALIVKRTTAAYDLLITASQNDNVWVDFSCDSGTHTVSIIYF